MKLLPLIIASIFIFTIHSAYSENYKYVIHCSKSSDGTSDLLLKWSNLHVEKKQNVTSKAIKTGETLNFNMDMNFTKSDVIHIKSRVDKNKIILSIYSNAGMFGPAYYTYEILNYKSSKSPVFEKMVGLNRSNEISTAQTNYFSECNVDYN